MSASNHLLLLILAQRRPLKPVHRPGACRPSRGLSKRPWAAPTTHPGAVSGVSGGTLARRSISEVAGSSKKTFRSTVLLHNPIF